MTCRGQDRPFVGKLQETVLTRVLEEMGLGLIVTVREQTKALETGGPHCKKWELASLGSLKGQVSGTNAGNVCPPSIQARSKLGKQTWAVGFTGQSNPHSGWACCQQLIWEMCPMLHPHPWPDSLLTKSLLDNLALFFNRERASCSGQYELSVLLKVDFSHNKWINWLSR